MGMSPSSQKLSIPARYDGAASVMCFKERWPIKVCNECGDDAPEMVDTHLFADCDLLGDKGDVFLMAGCLNACLSAHLQGKRSWCVCNAFILRCYFALSPVLTALDITPVQRTLLGAKSPKQLCSSPFAWQSSKHECNQPYRCRPQEIVVSDMDTCALQVVPPMLTPGVLLPLASCDIVAHYLGIGCEHLEMAGMDCTGCKCSSISFADSPVFAGAQCRGWEGV